MELLNPHTPSSESFSTHALRTGRKTENECMLSKTVCEHWRDKGRCKFGEHCRNAHSETFARFIPDVHKHPLGPDRASKRKKFFCDNCNRKSRERYRCTEGCDFDLCLSCFDRLTKSTGEEEEEATDPELLTKTQKEQLYRANSTPKGGGEATTHSET